MMRIFTGLSLAAALLAADVDRGIELYKQGKFSEAESELRSAVNENGDDARARRYLGLAAVEQKKYDEAAEQLNKAQELEPGGESKAALARMYAEKREFDQAETALEGAGGPQADYARGLIQLDRKQNEDAARNIESFLEANPDHAYAHYHAGLAYSGTKRKDKMLSHFETFLRLNPDAPEARKVRAVMKTGR